MQNKLINTAKIVWNDNNIPNSENFGDIYFSNQDPIAETQYVFLSGNHLPERFLNHTQDTFTIGETGFGSGLNFLLAWQLFLQFRQQYPAHQLKKLHFISVENFLLSSQDVRDIHAFYPQLAELVQQLQQNWPMPRAGMTQISFNDCQLTLYLGDVSKYPSFLATHRWLIDCWFFDGFSPAKNEAMWSESLFRDLFDLSQVSTTFATFTAAGFVRRNLQAAGFSVNKRKGFAQKREMLVGIKQ
ncbi:tRNA (5-methylaminomethyl-2-thiouridine)(34)-methyltransferase MnmD [Utexia brackfieldae]|uniref:tRNA (5-methylaminomethyl-2-thiouridine)(34)-methyltransferase MnmD n=1 Tax=Utexia brackfieldae TaxID=3074108 RepID=UPI00370D84C0